MYSYWEWIVAMPEDGNVVTLNNANRDHLAREMWEDQGWPLPASLMLETYPSVEAWRKHISYGSISGTWADWRANEDVSGWLEVREEARAQVVARLVKERITR